MQNASYTIKKFSENFSKINTIKQLIELSKDQKFGLEIDLIHRKTSVLTWNPAKDSLFGEYNLVIYPKIMIDGKNFTSPRVVSVAVPNNICAYEIAFLEALKNAISSLEEVWN